MKSEGKWFIPICPNSPPQANKLETRQRKKKTRLFLQGTVGQKVVVPKAPLSNLPVWNLRWNTLTAQVSSLGTWTKVMAHSGLWFGCHRTPTSVDYSERQESQIVETHSTTHLLVIQSANRTLSSDDDGFPIRRGGLLLLVQHLHTAVRTSYLLYFHRHIIWIRGLSHIASIAFSCLAIQDLVTLGTKGLLQSVGIDLYKAFCVRLSFFMTELAIHKRADMFALLSSPPKVG